VTEPKDKSSVYSVFEQSVERHGSKPFLRVPTESASEYSNNAIEFTYEAAAARVQELISGYASRGLSVGDRVAIAFDSRIECYLHLLALNALGVSIVPLNSGGSDDELAHVIGHSDSRMVVCLPDYQQRLSKIAEPLQCSDVIVEGELVGQRIGVQLADTQLTTEAALLYTSGTTGKPKGCMLSNEYFLDIGIWYVGLGNLCALNASDRLLTPLPPTHMNALCCSFMAMLLCGGCVIQLDRFHPRSWWQTVREERATVLHCLGVMTAILLTLPEDERDDVGGQVKFAFAPGSDPRHQSLFEARFGFPLIEAWAMTESGAGGLTIAHKEPRHVGQRCIGKCGETTLHRIVDESDVDVAPGEPGELLVRAKGDNPRKGFFSGYYKDAKATEQDWRGGWWHTGDVVREGDDGSLFFVDRRKNVIRRSGENIAAVEVEAVLLQIDAVDNCAVSAVPDEIRGDEVFAFVILNSAEVAISADEIFDHCMAHLTYFKAPGYVSIVDELPLTASQKISRGEVKGLAQQHVERGDCVDFRKLKKKNR
jgi:acyl-coenzyme A synthetase/AMP-(fatty) acid ligase